MFGTLSLQYLFLSFLLLLFVSFITKDAESSQQPMPPIINNNSDMNLSLINFYDNNASLLFNSEMLLLADELEIPL